jgi:hypothetical protein
MELLLYADAENLRLVSVLALGYILLIAALVNGTSLNDTIEYATCCGTS